MPSLHLFHRRTILAGDDLQPAALATATIRTVQFLVFLFPLAVHLHLEAEIRGGWIRYLLYDPSPGDDSCRHTHLHALLLTSYVAAFGLYCMASIVLEWRLMVWSSHGTPTETQPRNTKVGNLLELKLVPGSILLSTIALAGFMALAYTPLYYHCTGRTFSLRLKLWLAGYILLLFTQVTEVLVAWFYLFFLCTQSPVVDREPAPDLLVRNHELVEEMWAERCSNLCHCLGIASCFAFGGREVVNAEFGDVARALADYLETRGVLDVVPSDIATGLLILQQLQRERIHRAREMVLHDVREGNTMEEGAVRLEDLLIPLEASSRDPEENGRRSVYRFEPDGSFERHSRALLSSQIAIDVNVLDEGARYAKFALAIYTWVLYVYVHPCTGVFRLAKQAGCKCCSNQHAAESSRLSPRMHTPQVNDSGRIDGDNACETNKAGLLLTAGIEEADLVYASLRSGFNETPYAILADHEWRTVVLTIRGTFSLEDCVTDVLIEPEPLAKMGEEFGFDGTDQYCHGGVLSCVRNVYRDLQRHRHLDRLLLGSDAVYPDYSLRLTGHSLGAATCTLLSFMLRPKFPTLRCLNYSPPGCSLTWELATECHEWCNSFVLDSDLVPRLTIDGMEALRDDVLELLGRIKVPKVEVAQAFVEGSGIAAFHTCVGSDPMNQPFGLRNVQDMLYRPEEVPENVYSEQLARFKAIQQERKDARGTSRSVKLYPPGKIIHLVKSGENRSCLQGIAKCLTCCTTNLGFEYVPVYIENGDLEEIVVGPTMGTDHFPNRMCAILGAVAESYGV